jgi:LysR family glycine cleavage system transcriptional activator
VRIRSPSLIELHAFVAVVETGSFSRAAGRLSVTPGAVSRAVLRLEERLGGPLLEREPGGVRPTAAGQGYYGRVHAAIAALEAAVPARQRGAGRQGLRACVIPSLNMRWLVPRLPSFHAGHPGLDIVFMPYLADDDFRREDVDCWIQTRASATSRWPAHVQATYLLGKEIVPICHPSVADRIRSAADVLQFPQLHHVNYPDNWALWCRAHGVDPGRLALSAGFDLAAGLIEAVAANLGVAVVQHCLIEHEVAQRRVAVPLDRVASTGRGYYLCVPRARPGTPVLAAFKAWLLAQPVAAAPGVAPATQGRTQA